MGFAFRQQPDYAFTIRVHDIAANIFLRESKFVLRWNSNRPDLAIESFQQLKRPFHIKNSSLFEQDHLVCNCLKVRYNVSRKQDCFLL